MTLCCIYRDTTLIHWDGSHVNSVTLYILLLHNPNLHISHKHIFSYRKLCGGTFSCQVSNSCLFAPTTSPYQKFAMRVHIHAQPLLQVRLRKLEKHLSRDVQKMEHRRILHRTPNQCQGKRFRGYAGSGRVRHPDSEVGGSLLGRGAGQSGIVAPW